MKTVADYIQLMLESEAAINAVSPGAIATKDVPLGKVQKRKNGELKESEAYDGDNPLANAAGKFPLIGVGGESGHVEVEKGCTEPHSDEDKKHMFHMKQQYQNDQATS